MQGNLLFHLDLLAFFPILECLAWARIKWVLEVCQNSQDPKSQPHTPLLSQFAAELKSRISPPFKQAPLEPHPLCGLDFCPTNCHVNLMEVSYPKTTPSVGRSFSIRFGRKPSLIGLDPEQGNCTCPSKMCSDLTLQYLNRSMSEGQQARAGMVAIWSSGIQTPVFVCHHL